MRFASLGSGSKGNATVVHHGSTQILVDCGFSIKETEKRLAQLNIDPNDLTAILVTHEHGDHLRGALPLAKKYQLPVMMTTGTSSSLRGTPHTSIQIIHSDTVFNLGEFDITPVSVAHDAREPVQFVIRADGLTLGILTDLGTITSHVLGCYQHCDGLLVECNHDVAMLASGSYPSALKRRVGGDWGHLNNRQALYLLQNINYQRLQQLVIGHISQQNNDIAQVKEVISELDISPSIIHYACQEKGFSWIELSTL